MARNRARLDAPGSVVPKERLAEPTKKTAAPLVFVSHDHRDAPLAEAFSNLLTDASGGFLKSFRSSDRKGGAGIEFGAEWYSEIMGKIDDATDVVALLTPHSVDRPWILYEAGVAKGKLSKPVLGLVVGVAFDQATRGPFAQFQNSEADEDSLTKLVLQLIKRNSDAEPREEAVRRQVNAFQENIKQFASAKVDRKPSEPGEVEASAVAKLFEEIKVMFRDLPDRLQGQLSESIGPRLRRRRMHPMMTMDMLRSFESFEDRSVGWLMLISSVRDDAPWLYEIGLDLYRALRDGDDQTVLAAMKRFEQSLDMVRGNPSAHDMIDSPELEVLVLELGAFVHRNFPTLLKRASSKPPKTKSTLDSQH